LWALAKMKKLLVIDNYDSFTYNLVQLFLMFDISITVHRSDAITIAEAEKENPDYILISPGPKTPSHAGISVGIVRKLGSRIPIFGVCLGMQCINEAYGGKTVKCPVPVHGKTSPILHDGQGIFSGIPSPFTAARYHSLVARLSTNELTVCATTPDNLIMGIRHRKYPVFGVQFHPESFLTEHGMVMAENFLTRYDF